MILSIALGGALGAAGRHVVGHVVAERLGRDFPYGTLSVNILGSFLMGFLVVALASRFDASPELRGFLAVGVLGGFTTFSAYSLEIALLFERGAMQMSILYAFLSVILAVSALFGGMMVGRAVL
ncbi:MAG: fluoride efflux transporter CrcB [Sphingomonadales bacterium]|nr:fluoride efflux transporter CrcB [Sphingomonadales bacterium]